LNIPLRVRFGDKALTDRTYTIPSGCNSLDRLLGGGFPRSAVSLIYGEAGTGKTTLLTQVAIENARSGFRTLYIDSDRSFNDQRFRQIARSESDALSTMIILFMPNSFREQSLIIENLENYITPKLSLTIVDTITSLYRIAQSFEKDIFLLNRELNRQMGYLAGLSSKHGLAVLVSSQVHAQLRSESLSIEPVARRTLLHWPKNVLRLKSTLRPSIKEAILERLDGVDLHRSCLLYIGDKGLTTPP
jgi:DNA repair protein RadB